MPSSSSRTSFIFEATIHNPDDSPVTSGNFGVQYFNTLTDNWETIVAPVPAVNGIYNQTLDTLNPESSVAEMVATYVSVVQAGGFPTMRLYRESSSTLPEIVGTSGKVRKGATDEIGIVDFEDVWILELNQYERVGDGTQTELDDKVIAIRRPKNDNKLYKGLKNAIIQADIFDAFTQEEIESFFTNIANGTLVNMQGQIVDLQADLAAHVVTIAERDATIGTQIADIATKDADIAAKGGIIAQLQAQIAELEAAAVILNATIVERDATIATQVTDIAERDATISTQVADIAEKDGVIAVQLTEITTKDATIAGQLTEISDKDLSIATHVGTIAERDAMIVTKEAEVTEKEATIGTQTTEIAEKSVMIETHEAKIVEQETEIAAVGVQYEASRAELAGKEGDLVVCTATVLEREAEIASRDAEILTKECTIAQRETDISLKDAEIKTQDGKLKENEAIIAGHDAAIQEKLAEIATLDAQKGELEAEVASLTGPAMPVKDVYTNIVDELQSAADQLESGSSRFSLANLSLDLKTTVFQTPEGELLLQLVDNNSAKNVIEGAVSSLQFDVGEGGGTVAVGPGISPNVNGLTETAVRFKLSSLGLKLEPIYHPVGEDDDRVIGQSFKQTPAAGDDISAEGTITVIFAKKQDTQN
jgi:uncharacterized protein (DUF3084 family)